MDEFVRNKLEEWNLNVLVASFEDNAIDEEVFNALTEEMIKDLIPQIGFRYKFITKYKQYTTSIISENYTLTDNIITHSEDQSDTVTINSDRSSMSSTSLFDVLNCETFPLSPNLPVLTNISENINEIVEKPKMDPIVPDIQSKTVFIMSQIEASNQSISKFPILSNLKDLLPRDPRGKEIMSEFVSRNRLDRAKLAALIIDTQLGNNIDARISQSRFIQLAKEIIEIFPDEKLETYYKPYYRGSEGAVPARGILWDRYLYKRRVYRKIGLLKKPKEESLTEQIVEDKENVMNNLEWLKHNIEPFDEVMKRWLSTTSMRLRNLITIKQYFETYRCLQRPNGYVLIDVDFEYLYPHCKDNFFSAWSQISNKIITHAREVAEESSEIATLLSLNEKALEDGNIDIVALLILPLMLGSISLKANKANNHWRPSKLEVQTGFILHVETVDDMQPALEKRQRLIEKYKLTDQPLPIFIGQLTNLVSCSVKINDTMFTVSSPLKAIDICFKSFFVLNARYPIEAAHIWTFIEIYVYGIKNDSTKNYTKVNKLISTLNMQSV